MIEHIINDLKTSRNLTDSAHDVERLNNLKEKLNENLTLTSNGSNEVELLIEDISLRQKLTNQLSDSDSTFEVLSILNKMCSYSQDGYEKTLEIFDNYKSLKNERYKFKCIIIELEHLIINGGKNKNLTHDKNSNNDNLIVEILMLINNLLYGSKKVDERIRIRYEFIGLKINDLFKTITENYGRNEKIIEQINLFNTLRNKDEYNYSANDVDLNSHIDIFHAIYSQILGTPHEYTFLCILRHLLRLDSSNNNKMSDLIWEVIEKLVCRATVFDRDESMIGGTLERYSEEKFKNLLHETQKYNCNLNDNNTGTNKNDNLNKTNENSSQQFLAPPPPPPPPPPLPLDISAPNESKDRLNISSTKKSSNSCQNSTFFTNSSSHSNGRNSITSNQSEFVSLNNEKGLKLPQQCVPRPSIKMKPLVWSKIHTNRVIGKENVWTRFKNEYEKNDVLEYNDEAASVESLNYFQEIEEYFKTCENSRSKEVDLKETKLWPSSEKINLLDSKRSLNINIYLKQFRCSPDEILKYLSNNENKELGLENLEGMLKILPDANEVELLRGYQGEIDKLGEAEKFLIKLIQIPNYKLRIESLLLKEEFNSQMFYFNKSFDNIIKAADTVYNSFNLASMMLHICKTGNFINDGGYSGNAAGFKLSSLMKLSELKSNKHNITLLHVIIQQLEETNSKLVDLPKQLSVLKDTTGIQFENLKNEVTLFCNRVKKLNDQIKSADEFQSTSLDEFIDRAYNTINELENREKELDSWKHKLAEYFCEDPNCFRIEDCFNILFKFCEKMKAIIQENAERRSCELKRSRNIMNGSFHEMTQSNQPFHRTGSLTNRMNRYSADNYWVKSATDKELRKKQILNENDSPLSSSSSSSLIKSSVNNSSSQLETDLNKTKATIDDDNLDLDEFASSNESSFMRRANIRHSRKTALNRTTLSNISNGCNQSNQASTNESKYLLNFLNNGLEQNRELSSNRHGIVIMSNVDFNQPDKVEKIDGNKNEEKMKEIIKEEISLEIKNLNKKGNDDDYTSCIKPVTLRRTVSTSEVDLANKYNHRHGIISAALAEETSTNVNEETSSQSRSQSRSTNRLSGLKKLGSLYKQFEDDDDFMSNRSNKNSIKNDKLNKTCHSIKYIDDSDIENTTKTENNNNNRNSNDSSIKKYEFNKNESAKTKNDNSEVNKSARPLSNEIRKRSSLIVQHSNNNNETGSLSTHPSKYLISLTKDEPMHTITRANLEAKRALFETKKSNETSLAPPNNRNSLNSSYNSTSSNDVNNEPKDEDSLSSITRNSKFRYSTYLPNESHIHTSTNLFKQTNNSNGIVSNCIMKFENNSNNTNPKTNQISTYSSTVSSPHNTSINSENSQFMEAVSNDESITNNSSISIGPLKNNHLTIKRVNSVKVTPMDYAGDLDKFKQQYVPLNATIENESVSLGNTDQNKKVKSLSRNWELMANRANSCNNKTEQPNSVGVKSSSSFSFSTRPARIFEKIEKFNSNSSNTQQTHQTHTTDYNQQQVRQNQDYLNTTFTISEFDCKVSGDKIRAHSGGTNSDDYEMGSSKDDGFETQSNASSSQNGDTTINLKSKKLGDDVLSQSYEKKSIEPDDNRTSFNGYLVTITPPKSASNKNYLTGNINEMAYKSETQSNKTNEPSQIQKVSNSDSDKNNNNIKENSEMIIHHIERKCSKDSLNNEHTIYTTKNSGKLNAVVAIVNRSANKGTTRPLSSFTSSTTTLSNANTNLSRKEKISLTRTHSSFKNHSDNINNGCLSSSNYSSNMCLNGNGNISNGNNHNQNICESTRRKSGSASALYLCDTASTKAKKADIKQQQQQHPKETPIKINKEISSFDQYQQTNSNLTVSYYATTNQAMNRRNSMTKKSIEKLNSYNLNMNNQNLASSSSNSMSNKESNGSINIPIECPTKRQHPSVFDRLSRSSRKV